jgi:hypothetical protein
LDVLVPVLFTAGLVLFLCDFFTLLLLEAGAVLVLWLAAGAAGAAGLAGV